MYHYGRNSAYVIGQTLAIGCIKEELVSSFYRKKTASKKEIVDENER